MGWRFRRTATLGGFRWTMSKQGVGASWGLAGVLRFGLSPDGRRYVSVRIPGTGVSWIKYYGTLSQSSPSTLPSNPPQLPSPSQKPAPSAPPTQPWWKQKKP